jgi:HTH-type transcriptional regulator/antitoxin HigA
MVGTHSVVPSTRGTRTPLGCNETDVPRDHGASAPRLPTSPPSGAWPGRQPGAARSGDPWCGLDAADGTPEAAYIDAQSAVLEAFEKRHWPIPQEWGGDWDPVDLIRATMAERGIAQRELAACFGSQPNCSAVLNRRRGLTLPMVRRLHAKLGIPADLLIRECRRTG